MTDQQRQNIKGILNALYNDEVVTLSSKDIETIELLFNAYNNGYDKGFLEGIEYVTSGEMDYDEMKEDALKGTY